MPLICSAGENLFEKGKEGDLSFLKGGVGYAGKGDSQGNSKRILIKIDLFKQ